MVLLRGKVSDRERDEEDPPVFLDAAEPLRGIPGSGRLAVRIILHPHDEFAADAFGRARKVMVARAGEAPVEVAVGDGNGAALPRLRSRSLKVSPDRDTIRALEEVFGKGRVGLVRV